MVSVFQPFSGKKSVATEILSHRTYALNLQTQTLRYNGAFLPMFIAS